MTNKKPSLQIKVVDKSTFQGEKKSFNSQPTLEQRNGNLHNQNFNGKPTLKLRNTDSGSETKD